MTENQIKKLNGKRVRFSKQTFKHSVHVEEFEGKIEISSDMVYTNRGGKIIGKEHVGFYLHPLEGFYGTSWYFDYRAIQCITKLEVIE